MALVRVSICLGAYPKSWKVSKGVIIPKLGKEDDMKVKSYRVILLLNYEGNIVEKVVPTMLLDYSERKGIYHLGQSR
jgi:hypothetical protein